MQDYRQEFSLDEVQLTHERISSGRRAGPSLLSVVVPVFNEEAVLSETYVRLSKVLSELDLPYEIVFVDDGSTDNTASILGLICDMDQHVKGVNFSRNFGHQIAVTAGIDYASGDVVVLIDADLQDPPELITDFMDKWAEGYDVVYAVRSQRAGETWFKRLTAQAFYRVLHKLTPDVNIPLDTGDFRLMDKKVVDSLRSIKEKHRFIRGLVSWTGFNQIGIPYERAERFAGESKYPLRKMLRFSMDGITSFSFKPLQWATTLGFIVSGLGFVSIIILLWMKVFTSMTLRGWTSLMVVALFIGGIELIVLGIIGEYIGRIYDEVRDRPLYLIRSESNIEHSFTRK